MTPQQARDLFRSITLKSELLDRIGYNFTDTELKVLRCCDIRGLTEQEAARELNMTERTVQNYKKKAYQRLAKILTTY